MKILAHNGGLGRVTSPPRVNELVYFSITNIEHDIMQNDASTDVYVGSMLGELGCWVDPAVTRMVQTGVQHSWVPDLGKYIEMGNSKRIN